MAADDRSRHSTKRRTAHAGSPASPASLPTLGRVPWWAVILSLLVLVSADFAVDPIRNASTFQRVPDVHLVLSTGYLLLAPICSVLDTLSLMSVRQHIAILLTLVALFAACRAWRGLRHGTGPLRELKAAALALGGLVLVYAVGALVPRPMAALSVDTPFNDAVLVADFHSHTKFSHDGAPWFSPEANRRWHRNAGFDVAYITDHRTVQGAEDGIANNPPVAGEGTMILQGLEVVWRGAHVNLLGAERRYRGLTDPALRDLDDTSLALASAIPNSEPIVVYTFPDLMRNLHPAHGPGTPGARAIEIIDASPRGLGDVRRLRTVISYVADTFNLALVAGSDNHGWGFTAAGWTLVSLPGWRGMSTDSLAAAIDDVIRTRGFEGTTVVERRVANTRGFTWRLIATAPLVVSRMFTMLTNDERVSWLLWIWAIALAPVAWRRRRPRGAAGAA